MYENALTSPNAPKRMLARRAASSQTSASRTHNTLFFILRVTMRPVLNVRQTRITTLMLPSRVTRLYEIDTNTLVLNLRYMISPRCITYILNSCKCSSLQNKSIKPRPPIVDIIMIIKEWEKSGPSEDPFLITPFDWFFESFIFP